MLTIKRRDQILKGQTGQAKTVFEYVPIQGEWTVKEIASYMIQGNKRMDLRQTQGALNGLVEAGLAKMRVCAGIEKYSRAPVAPEVATPAPVAEPAVVVLLGPVEDVVLRAPAVKPADKSPVSLLGAIAAEIRDAAEKAYAAETASLEALKSASEVRRRQALDRAQQVEDAALTIEEGIQANSADAERLKQLRALLGTA